MENITKSPLKDNISNSFILNYLFSTYFEPNREKYICVAVVADGFLRFLALTGGIYHLPSTSFQFPYPKQ